MSDPAPTIGLVLGGGGIAGYAFHSGVLHALQEETGFDPRTAEVVVGTSAGSIAAAMIRGDVPAAEMAKRLATSADRPEEMEALRLVAVRSPKAIPRLWAGPSSPRLAVQEIRQGRRLRLTRLLTGLAPQGRLTLTPITGPLAALYGQAWPARRLWIPATDLQTGRRVVFGRDEWPTVAAAVEASAALPGFFVPAQIGGRTYVDGGISSPFNADLLIGYRTGPVDHEPVVFDIDAAMEHLESGSLETAWVNGSLDRARANGSLDNGSTDSRPLDLVVILAPLSIDELNRGNPLASVARSLPRRRLKGEVRWIEDGGTRALVFQPGRAVARAMGLNPMDHSRVQSIVARSDELVRRQITATPEPVIELLRRAGELLPAPPDAAYPLG